MDLETKAELSPEEIHSLHARVQAGGKAKDFLAHELSEWFTRIVLASMQDEAIAMMTRARTNEDRLKAQQTLLAAQKPLKMLERLIQQGEDAKTQLLDLENSTRAADEN